MTHRRRILVAGLLAVAGLAAALNALWLGLMVGVMGTDACRPDAFGLLMLWLIPGYPVYLLIAALLPSVLVMRGARTRRVVLAALLGAVGTVAWMVVWFFIVTSNCA